MSGLSELEGICATSSPGPDPLVGAALDGVKIVRLIAEGGMGRVYEGWQEHPGRAVAVKVMRAGIASGSLLKRFEHEARILGRLRHPGIAHVHTVGIHALAGRREPYFVMEFVPHAESIVAYAESRCLTTTQRMELFRQVCLAVAHGHQRGVIHRDLKPSNILVDAAGQAKVIDFGVARCTDTDIALTTLHTDTGQLIGTLQYMSPEQFEADPDELDVRSDVYALGVVLYELLTGHPPYELRQKPVYEAARVVREATPVPLSSVNRKLRRDVSIIALKCLEKDRARRYASASELGADIGRFLVGDPILAAPPALSDSLRRLARRHRAAAAAIAGTFAALTVAVAGISVFYVRAEREKQQAVVERNRAVQKEAEAEAQAAEANRQKRRAELETARASDRVYVGNLYRASDKVAEHNFDKALSLLRENHSLPEGAGHPIELRCLEAQLDRAYAVLRGHPDGVFSVAFSPDGSRVTTSGGDSTRRSWDAASGELIMSHAVFPVASPVWVPLGGGPRWVAIGPPFVVDRGAASAFGGRQSILSSHGIVARAANADASRSVTAHADGLVRLWDSRSKAKLASWKVHGASRLPAAAISQLAVNADASLVAAVCGRRRLLLWHPGTGEVVEAGGHSDDVRALAFSPDGSLLATASMDRTARLWDATAGTPFAVLDGHCNGVTSVAFSPDGKRVATASAGAYDSTARLWDVVAGGELNSLTGHTDKLVSLRFTPDGGRLVTAAADRTARIWDIKTARELAVLTGHSGSLTGLAVSPDGRRIVTGSADGTAILWNAVSGRQVVTLRGHGKGVTSLAVSEDGALLVTGAMDDSVRIWDMETGRLRAVLQGHAGGVTSVAISPDATRCASGSSDRTARLWDIATGETIAVLAGHTAPITAVRFNHDGRRLATAAAGPWRTTSNTLRIWDGVTGAEVVSASDAGGTIHSLAFSPDDRWLAGGTLGSVVSIWDCREGGRLKGLRGHSDAAYGIAFSPDSRRLATTSADHTVRIWDTSRGEELAVLRGHTDHVVMAAFSPDGAYVATASDDRTARIWGLSNADIHRARLAADGIRDRLASQIDGWCADGVEAAIRSLEASRSDLSPADHAEAANMVLTRMSAVQDSPSRARPP